MHRIAVIADAFNVLNRANFLIANNTFGAAADPRQVQLGVRWSY